MIDKQVRVDFDVNGAQYGASMQQMIAVTQQYNQVADTTLGKVAQLGGFITSKMVSATAGLTKANKTATSQAAAYQQKMSQLEATTKLLGEKTFPKLEKATLKLARDFPIGIGQAVEQMESLQRSGVSTEKQMVKLSKAYTELGAANQAFGPAIGTAMTEFTRTMGNNLASVEKYGDTLTTLTKQFGGSAQSVLGFSKSIAPIASTIGLNQAQVTGLSTAFARLGEDGFAAGNALNKVMIDLNRAARDGGPELRAYAQVMNRSVEDLGRQLQNDPASVLVDFTKAINAAGPDAIRMLESLGIEGVRTTKAITALAREGNLGEILDVAAKAYGSGSTSKAAETALSGVNDEMSRLAESTNQMVATAGKPFLGWLQTVLGLANGVSDAFVKLTSSLPAQGLAQLGAVFNITAGGAMTAVQAAGTYAFASRLFGQRGMRGRAQQRFRSGQQAGAGANVGDTSGFMDMQGGMLSSLGYAWAVGRGQTPDDLAARGGGIGRVAQGAARATAGGLRMSKDAVTLLAAATANDLRTAFGREGYVTRGGQQFMGTMSNLKADVIAGDTVKGLKTAGRELGQLAKTSAATGKAFGSTTAAAAALASGMRITAASAVRTGATGLGAFGQALGITPVMAGVMAVGAVGYGAYKYKENRDSLGEALQESANDPMRAFNDFAVKAGYATEQITLLGRAASETARSMADANTSEEEAFQLSSKEIALARSAGYESAFTGTGNAEADALKAFAMNPDASLSQIARMGMDITAQYGSDIGQKFLDAYQANRGRDAVDVASALVKQADSQQSRWLGLNTDESRATMQSAQAYYEMRWSDTERREGTEGGLRQKAVDLNQLFDAMVKAPAAQWEEYEQLIASLADTDVKAVRRARAYQQSGMGSGFEGLVTQGGEELVDLKNAWNNRGRAVAPQEIEFVKESRAQTQALYQTSGALIDLTDTLYAANKISAETGDALSELTDVQLASLDSNEKLIAKAVSKPEDVGARNQAANALIEEALKAAGGNAYMARAALMQQYATAPAGQSEVIGAALGGWGNNIAVQSATRGMSQWDRMREAARAAQATLALPMPSASDAGAVAAREEAMASLFSMREQSDAMALSLAKTLRESGIQMERSTAALNRSIARQRKDFNRQMDWQEDDYLHQRKLARKQYNTSLLRQEDAFQTSMLRSNRDFTISMERSEASFQRNRERTLADHNKQLERQAEDNAKAMYSPYQRVEHQRVWDTQQLMTNLRQQNEVLARQMSQVDLLKGAGLSQSAVDMLGLADPANAQQLAKMFGEMMNDPSLIASMNDAVAGRIDLATMFTTDEDNVAFRRNEEDFALSLARQDEDFRIAMDESRADFAKQIADANADYAKQKAYQQEDFNLQMSEMARQFNIGVKRGQAQMATAIARAKEDAAIARSQMAADILRSAEDVYETLNGVADDAMDYVAKLPKKYRKPLTEALEALIGYANSKDLEVNVTLVADEFKFAPGKGKEWNAALGAWMPGGSGGYGDNFKGVTGNGTAGWSGSWKTYRSGGFHGGADLGRKGDPVFSATDGTVKEVKTLASRQNPSGSYGRYVMISDGRYDFYYAHLADQRVLPGQKVWQGSRIGTVGNTGNTRPIGGGHHLHFEVRPKGGGHYSAVNPSAWLSEGGIVFGRQTVGVGEGSHPEMVMPLNRDGAKVLAETMGRYLEGHEAQAARVAPFSTVVVNNTTMNQDYSTNFTGPVHVAANDPNEMARALRQVSRRRNLVQPIGGRA